MAWSLLRLSLSIFCGFSDSKRVKRPMRVCFPKFDIIVVKLKDVAEVGRDNV